MEINRFKLLSKIIDKSDNPIAKAAIEKFFHYGIPFNRPHKIKILKLTKAHSIMHIPHKTINTNHLGTIHACAIATVGEFAGGLTLVKNFDPAAYRIVMTELKATYHRPGNTGLDASSELTSEKIHQIREELQKNQQSLVTMHSKITNQANEHVADIFTTWQVKAWSQTRAPKSRTKVQTDK